MIKSMEDPETTFYDVIDVESNKKIPNICWANDETGEYDVFLTDDIGRFRLNENGTGVKFERRRGSIKIVKREIIE